MDGACVVGLGEMDLQVKASSESVQCYAVKLSLLQALLARTLPTSRENSRDLHYASAVASPTWQEPSHA